MIHLRHLPNRHLSQLVLIFHREDAAREWAKRFPVSHPVPIKEDWARRTHRTVEWFLHGRIHGIFDCSFPPHQEEFSLREAATLVGITRNW